MWCNRPRVREVFPNHDVVVFQPRTVTPLHLGSVSYRYTFKLGLSPQLFLLQFYGSFFSLLRPTAYPYVAVHSWSPPTFHFLSTSSTGAKRRPPGRCPHPAPARFRRSSLCPASRDCIYHHFPWWYAPPLPILAYTQVLVSPWGAHPLRVHTRLCVPISPSLSFLQILPSSGSWYSCWMDFSARVRSQGDSTPWHSRALVLSPPATWT